MKPMISTLHDIVEEYLEGDAFTDQGRSDVRSSARKLALAISGQPDPALVPWQDLQDAVRRFGRWMEAEVEA